MIYLLAMLSRYHSLKLLLIHKITPHSKLPLFAFSTLNTVIVSPQCLHKKSPPPTNNNNNNKISSSDIVSYLIDSCGLYSESAKSAFMSLKFKTLKGPDLVLEFLKNHGFNNTQISRLVRERPRLLLCNPKKNLLPKFKFLYSLGFSKHDLANLLSLYPVILLRSLDNHFIPFYRSLRSAFRSDIKVITFFKRGTLNSNSKFLVPNITALRKLAVPASNIELLTVNFPRTVLQKRDQFLEAIDRLREMGFDPLKATFVLAVHVLSAKSNKLIWDRCTKAYKKWGWSEDDILSAFKRHPHCMILSTDKIDRAMDLFGNKMGYESTVIAKIPSVLFYDVEKRAIPRCLVHQVLTSRGLIKKMGLHSILGPAEKYFLERFVIRYEDQLPQLIRVYREKVDILAL